MSRFASKETVARLREQYTEGMRVELISMDDPYTKLIPGEKGSVSLVDDAGTIFVDWDSGSRLGVVYGVDNVKRIENEIRYETGADFFRNTALRHGVDEADVREIPNPLASADLKTLPSYKPSVLGKIQGARKAPAALHQDKPESNKHKNGPAL